MHQVSFWHDGYYRGQLLCILWGTAFTHQKGDLPWMWGVEKYLAVLHHGRPYRRWRKLAKDIV